MLPRYYLPAIFKTAHAITYAAIDDARHFSRLVAVNHATDDATLERCADFVVVPAMMLADKDIHMRAVAICHALSDHHIFDANDIYRSAIT